MTESSKSKRGAPARNGNHIQHGRHALTMGALPPGCGYVRRACNAIRTQLERAVVSLRGEINLADAATIQTAVRFERHAQLAQRWLRENPELPVETKLTISRDIAKASSERDRCIRALGLETGKSVNPWDAIHPASPALPWRATDTTDDDRDDSESSIVPGASGSATVDSGPADSSDHNGTPGNPGQPK